jgi:hypothetical protein
LNAPSPDAAFETLITSIHDESGQGVVVLIDEYDDPINHYLGNPALMTANSEVLSKFYGSFKTIESCLKFVFVTGVTRYAMMGLSAGLNNLYDISLNSQYASICGFTPE